MSNQLIYIEHHYIQEYVIGNKCGEVGEDTLDNIKQSGIGVYTSLSEAVASGLVVKGR